MLSIYENMLPKDTKQLAALQDRLNADTELKLQNLFQRVVKESADSILNRGYKTFDALVGNFGCQITALYVQENIRKQSIIDEAIRISSQGAPMHTTEEMLNFARLRLLCIVNKNVVENDREKPVTNYTAISDEKFVEPLIRGTQIDEAKKAALYVRHALANMQFDRADLCRRIFETKSYKMVINGIEKLPCLYNIEVVFRRMVGVVLIKNKLFLGDNPIANAKTVKILLALPQNRIIDEQLDPNMPLVVIEAYIRDVGGLRNMLAQESLVDIVQADIFFECKADEKANFMQDRDVLSHKARLSSLPRFMAIDHIYCASAAEEGV